MIFQDVSGVSQRSDEPPAHGVGGSGDTPAGVKAESAGVGLGEHWILLPARLHPAPIQSPHWKLTEDTGGGRSGL